MTWRRMDVDGPPPTTRLTLAMCPVRLHVPDAQPPGEEEGEEEGGAATAGAGAGGDSTQQILAAGQRAKEAVEEQLRLSSAGSVRSVNSSSAGSQRSEPTLISPQLPDAVPVSPLPRPAPQDIHGPSKVVDMLLVHGGMDTEGEIFDDCLVYMLKEERYKDGEEATAATAALSS